MNRHLKFAVIATALIGTLSLQGSVLGSVTYTYDALGRLVKTEYSTQGSAVDYQYDPAGNRSTVTVSGTGVSSYSAVADAASADYGVMKLISPLANDNGGTAPITVSSVTAPANGTAVIAANGTDIEYTPNAGFVGVDSFDYTGLDADSDSSLATVSVTVAGPVTFDIAADASGEEGNAVVFTVSKTGTVSSTQTVDIATVAGTATAADFTSASQTLTFLAADTSKTFSVTTTEDTMYEGNEVFTAQLSNPSAGAALGTNTTRTGTINDDDGISFAVNDVSISEGGALSFTVTKTGSATMSHDISYATANGTAGASDYTAISSTVLTFAAADVTKTVTVATTVDATYENNETVNLNLSAPTNNATITDSQGIGTINNDDAAPSFTVNDVSVSEGGNLSYTVTKTGATALSHNVNYATANSSAIAGSDYTTKSGTLTFAAADATKTVSVATLVDTLYEYNETSLINLSAATSGATIADSQGNGYILEGGAGPSFTINNVTREEGLSLTFTVTKTGATVRTHNINYATANGTASAGSDYTAKSGLLSFNSTQTSKTVTITGIEDTNVEANETFFVNLSSATNGATITDSQGLGTITNDDAANSPPVAVNDNYTNVDKSVWTILNVMWNDTDPDGDPLSITAASSQGAQVTIINNGNQVQYRCLSCASLTSGVTYTISDGNGGTDTGFASITFSTGGGGGGGPEP